MSNCLFWAWWQKFKYGGNILFCRSEYWIGGFHVVWEDEDGVKRSYKPKYPKKRYIPPPLFRGIVRVYHGDCHKLW